MSSTATAASGSSVIGRFLSSTIGLKVLMAVTGAIWIGFVLGHMVGNLQVFAPVPAAAPHPLNVYAAFLQGLGGVLWLARIALLLAFVAHVRAAMMLSALNRQARPQTYKNKKNLQASPTSYYMLVSGLVLLAFLLYHIAHLTLGVTNPELAALPLDHGLINVYAKVLASFRQPLIAGIYVIANVFLGLHLHHAVSSMVQTLGLRTPRYAPLVDKLGPAVGGLVIVGNLSMPLAVWLGVVGVVGA